MPDQIKSDQAAHQPCCRVLIIDDDSIAREQYQELLTRWGYTVCSAEGEGLDLLADARRKAREQRAHLALVDMCLLDDEGKKDVSGLELIPELLPTVAIVLSAYGSVPTARDALVERKALDFVGKEEGPEKLKEVLARHAACYCQAALHIDWPPGYEPAMLLRRLQEVDPQTPPDEVGCVINRLYAEAAFVRAAFRPIGEVYRSTEVAPPGRSVVLEAHAQYPDGHWHQKEIVKIANRDHIQTEFDHYQKHVRPFLAPQRIALIEHASAVMLWDVGAIRYTDVAVEKRKPLHYWYDSAPKAQLVAALRDLFTATLGGWRDHRGNQAPGRIDDYYQSHFDKLRDRIARHADDAPLQLPGITPPLLDPVAWVRKHGAQSAFVTCWEAYTHGDLHADNVYVDQYGQTCIIDYEKSGPGYILRDYVELETDIWLRLLSPQIDDLSLIYHLDLLLLNPDHPRRSMTWEDCPAATKAQQKELRKAFDAIREVRRLAYEQVRFAEMSEYYWALLMETLFSVLRTYEGWPDRAEAERIRLRAQLAAALLCERLAHWRRPWPPEHLKPVAPLPPAGSANERADIRQLLLSALNDQDLTALCQDHFPKAYNQFTDGMGHDQKVTLVLDYCQRTEQMEMLLAEAEKLNSAPFKRYREQRSK